MCPAHTNKVEIKCMGSVGGKTPTEPKLYLFFSNLRHIKQDEVDVICLFNYDLGGKIRRLSMNAVFKFIWPKGLSFLTYRRIIYVYIMYQTLHDYDYHLPEIRCATF